MDISAYILCPFDFCISVGLFLVIRGMPAPPIPSTPVAVYPNANSAVHRDRKRDKACLGYVCINLGLIFLVLLLYVKYVDEKYM